MTSFISYFLLLTISAVARGQIGTVDCSAENNEHFELCGSSYQPTCATADLICVPKNQGPCASGCYCDTGYVRDSSNKCIPEDKCPKTAQCPGPNEHYSSCGNGCHVTCNSIGVICDNLTLQCHEGCYCDNGYVRNSNNVCVPIQECLSK